MAQTNNRSPSTARSRKARPPAPPDPAPVAEPPGTTGNPGATSTNVTLEPGVTLPAPKPPKNARDKRARKASKGKAKAADPVKVADKPEAPPVPETVEVVSIQVLRDGVPTELPADSEPQDGYERAKVAIARHLYYVTSENSRGDRVRRHYRADRGDVLELPAEEIERGREVGALVDLDAVVPQIHKNPLDLDDEQLAAWVDTHHVDEVIALAT